MPRSYDTLENEHKPLITGSRLSSVHLGVRGRGERGEEERSLWGREDFEGFAQYVHSLLRADGFVTVGIYMSTFI